MKSKKTELERNLQSSTKSTKKRKHDLNDDDNDDDKKPQVKKVKKPSGIVTEVKVSKSSSDVNEMSIEATKKPKKTKLVVKQNPTKTGNVLEKKKPEKMLHANAKKLKLTTKGTKNKSNSEHKLTTAGGSKVSKKTKLDEMTKKDRKKLRKMKNAHFDLSTKAKALWEEFRRSDLGADRKQACSDELFRLIKGNAHVLVFAHDTSRIIQCMIKRGTVEQRDAIFKELEAHLVEIMTSKYAKFFITKLLKYGTKAQRNAIFTAMQGKLRKLLRHREAAAVVEIAYNNYAQANQRTAMASVFYGKVFSVFRSPEEKTLRAFVDSHPDKRDDVVSFLKDSLMTLVDKSVLQHSFVHRLFLDFFNCANDTQKSEMIEAIREHIVHMLHTHDGARVAMMCLWHGTAKDRKIIIKSFKTFVVKISKEEFGHMVLLALLDVVDDTKIVNKAILDELLKSLDDVSSDKYGRKVLFYLLLPRDPLHFHPDIITVLQQGDTNRHSKKDAALRHSELLSYVSPTLLLWVSTNCRKLMSERESQLLVLSAVKHCTGDVTELMQNIAQVVAEPFQPGSHIVDDTGGHLVLKRLILNDTERIKAGQTVLFSTILLNTVPADRLHSWTSCNRGCFMLVSLMEVGDATVTERLNKCLKTVKEKLQQEQHKLKGAQVLLSKLTGQVTVNSDCKKNVKTVKMDVDS